MNKKILKFFFVMCLLLPCAFLATGCDKEDNPAPHSHNYSNVAQIDNNSSKHKKTCSCGEVIEEDHNYGAWTVDTTNPLRHIKTCSDCGYAQYDVHSASDWSQNATQHYHHCDVCNADYDTADHSYNWAVDPEDSTKHIGTCACGFTKTEEHSGGTATCQARAECAYCGEKYGTLAGHNYATTYSSNETHHWRECTTNGCSEQTDYAAHTYTNGIEDCVCGKEAPTPLDTIAPVNVSNSGCFDNSQPFTPETEKLFVFELRTANLTNYRDTFNVTVIRNVNDKVITTAHQVKVYNANKELVSENGTPENGTNVLNEQGKQSTYYIVVKFTADPSTMGDVKVKVKEFDNVNSGSIRSMNEDGFSKSSNNPDFKFTANSSVPTGSVLFIKPTADDSLLNANEFTIKKLNGVDNIVPLSANNYRYVAGEGIYLTLEASTTYYITLTPTETATDYQLKNVDLVYDYQIATCGYNETQTIIKDDGYQGDEIFSIKYVANEVENSALNISLNIDKDAYDLYVCQTRIESGSMAGYVGRTVDLNKFTYNEVSGVWEYKGTSNISGKTFIIFVVLKEAQDEFTVSVQQYQKVRVVKLDLNGGTLDSQTGTLTDKTITEGANALNNNIPTKTDYTFRGFFYNNVCYISADGVAQNLSQLTASGDNTYTLVAHWAQPLATCAEVVSVPLEPLSDDNYYAITTGNWTLPQGQETAQARIEIANRDMLSYVLVVYDVSGNSISVVSQGTPVYDLKPNTQYFIKLRGNGSAIDNETLVINRDLVTNTSGLVSTYELHGISVVANEKVVLRLNQNWGSPYTLEITREPANSVVSGSFLSLIKIYDQDMTLIKSLTETSVGNGQYSLGMLNANTTYYVEIVFNSSLSNVNFTLQ